ncbi:MAG: hypothetical protein WC269_06495, partial [Candidatus Gracilibacteria bacterium]
MNNLNDIITNLFLISASGGLSFLIALALTPWFTKQLVKFKIGKTIRENALSGEKSSIFSELHAKKSGTPTMGGLLIWGTIIIVVLLSRVISASGLTDRSLLNRKET